MHTLDYSYDVSLKNSIKNTWTVDEVFRGRDFDFTKPFLPERIAGVNGIDCLNPDEKRMLNQIRANSYGHIFAFVEEFIVPLVVDQARADVYGDETRLWSLLRFAEEELKHQQMLQRAGQQFRDQIHRQRQVLTVEHRGKGENRAAQGAGEAAAHHAHQN